jgi:hypothetical protein
MVCSRECDGPEKISPIEPDREHRDVVAQHVPEECVHRVEYAVQQFREARFGSGSPQGADTA